MRGGEPHNRGRYMRTDATAASYFREKNYSRPDPVLRVFDSSVPEERVRSSVAGVAADAGVVCGGGIVVTAPGPDCPTGVAGVVEAGVGVIVPVGFASRVRSVPRVVPVARRLSAFDCEPVGAAVPAGFLISTGCFADPTATPICIGAYGSHHVGCEYGFCQPYGSYASPCTL